ncbi:MAG: GIY-YIG nuclease family protein [Chitinophagaceae bacterium]|nr:GIY-YIG nuclease family protein [Chitinophagaceae bacterium]
MYFVYILYSAKCNKYYIGFSTDVTARLLRHNSGMVTATKNCRPYSLIKTKSFPTEALARAEEKRLKRMKSRTYLERLIKENW